MWSNAASPLSIPEFSDPNRGVTESRRRILAAARTLLRQHSYQSFSIEAVASLAGLTRRTVYNLFADRLTLYRMSRAALLAEFEPLLPQREADGIPLRHALEEFARQALVALGTPGHHELLASVRRDGAFLPWIAELYRERVEQLLSRTLDAALAADAERDADSRARLVLGGIGLLRAAIGEPDTQPTLGPHEFAHILEARLGATPLLLQAETGPRAIATSAAPARRPIIRRGAVLISFDPIDVRWNDIPVPLSPLEADLLVLVARRDRVPWSDIDAFLRESGASLESRDVLICRLRHKFTGIGAADPLETVRRWGLRFRVEQDIRGSRTTWIGASERNREEDRPGASSI